MYMHSDSVVASRETREPRRRLHLRGAAEVTEDYGRMVGDERVGEERVGEERRGEGTTVLCYAQVQLEGSTQCMKI